MDVLVCVPSENLLTHLLDLTVSSMVAARVKLQESKIQRMPPWKYLGLKISKQAVVLQKLLIKTKIMTLADVHQLCGELNWVRPCLSLITEDLVLLFNLLERRKESQFSEGAHPGGTESTGKHSRTHVHQTGELM